MPLGYPHVETLTLIRCCSKSDLHQNYVYEICLPRNYEVFLIDTVRMIIDIGSKDLQRKVVAALHFSLEFPTPGRGRSREDLPTGAMCNKDMDLGYFIDTRESCPYLSYQFQTMDIGIPRVPNKPYEPPPPPEPTEKELRAKRRKEFRQSGARMLDVEIEKPRVKPKKKVEEQDWGAPSVEVPDILAEFNEFNGLKIIELVFRGRDVPDMESALPRY